MTPYITTTCLTRPRPLISGTKRQMTLSITTTFMRIKTTGQYWQRRVNRSVTSFNGHREIKVTTRDATDQSCVTVTVHASYAPPLHRYSPLDWSLCSSPISSAVCLRDWLVIPSPSVRGGSINYRGGGFWYHGRAWRIGTRPLTNEV